MMQDLWMLVRGLLKSGRRLDSAGVDSRGLWLALAVKFGSKNGRLNGDFLWGYPNSWIVYDGKAMKTL